MLADFQNDKIKNGEITKIIDKDTLEVENNKSGKLETIKVVNILDKKLVKDAKEKDRIAKEEAKKAEDAKAKEIAKDTRTSSEKSEDNLKKEKGDTIDAKQGLKSKRKEKRAAKKNVRKRKRADKRSGRQDKKQARILNRTKKQQDKIDNIGESKVYTFDEFIKNVSKLS